MKSKEKNLRQFNYIDAFNNSKFIKKIIAKEIKKRDYIF